MFLQAQILIMRKNLNKILGLFRDEISRAALCLNNYADPPAEWRLV